MRETAMRVLRLIDLTSLDPADDVARIEALCAKALTPFGPAAVCVLPAFVATASRALTGAAVRVAAVANFPHGAASPEATAAEIEAARADGADEVDVVLPWRALAAGDRRAASDLLDAARAAAGDGVLKVILETGALSGAEAIRAAAELALAHGADFLKTSTGKVAVGATPEAARVLIGAVKAAGRPCGLKLSGGIRTLASAAEYLALHDAAFGEAAATPDRLRFGASSLFDEVLAAV